MKKKLLIYAHYYYPDVASTGQILQELAEGLKEQFDITIVCTVPSYTGKIEAKYKTQKFYFEEINGVNVIRIRVPEFDKSSKISRIKNIVAYYFGARKATRLAGKQDFVYTISQPPVLGGVLGVYGKKKCKAKLIYNIQDFNPEQIEAVQYTKLKPVLSIMRAVDKRTCRKADKVIIVGRDMVETLKKRFPKGPMPEFAVINNWIDEKKIYPLAPSNEGVRAFKKQYGLEGKYVVMYSGNIGLYYDLQNIIKLAEPYRDRQDVAFVFVGQGSIEGELKAYVKETGLDNVRFIPYQPKEALNYSLNAADVHWVVNAQGIKGVSVPSKLYGIMGVGKPVLGVLEEGSEARMIIEESGCGLVAAPKDYDSVAKILDEYLSGRANGADMGASGRSFLEKNLTKEVSVAKYAKEIEEC